MSTKLRELLSALIDCIERAPDKQQEALYDALQAYLAWRSPARRMPPLFERFAEAIEEGTYSVPMHREIEREEMGGRAMTAFLIIIVAIIVVATRMPRAR
jgi:hypothetical protein